MSFSGFQRALANTSSDLRGTDKALGIGGIISVPSATLTYTLIASNVTQDQTFTVSGAALGDFVQVAPLATLTAGLELCAFVSAANTVTIRVGNATAGGITPGALVFNILILKL